MVKLCGMALIVLCGSLTGLNLGRGLTARVRVLEEVIRLYRYLRDRLKYLRPSVSALIEAAAESGEFEALKFLPACNARMKSGLGFSESWRLSVAEEAPALGRDALPAVQSLAGVIGASDIDSQLSAIDYGISVLEDRLEQARQKAAGKSRLYGTLGLLAGLGVSVLVA